jgi:nucleoside-diphosphate-sugar epimerase
MLKNLIIGRDSNLSNALSTGLDCCSLVSSRELNKNVSILSQFLKKDINIIFNNFQSATQINDLANPKNYIKNSILATAIVLDFFKDSGTNINKIIYTSSSSVYGNNSFCNENDKLMPENLYASLKIANEKLIEKFCVENKIDYSILRVFNMYGGDDNFSIISKILESHRTKRELVVFNDGKAIRDFIHISDVIEIYKKILEIKNIKVINVGTGQGTCINNILDYLSNNGINLNTKNINRDELKKSTANTKLLHYLTKKTNFININEFIKKELNIIS